MSTDSTRCLYKSSFQQFIEADENSIFGILCDKYHGDALTTTREAWKEEIALLKTVLSEYSGEDGQIIFEYDIPRLGKRIDTVLLFRGIIFCLEFKVGENKILEADVDQVLDYALDLKNFHEYSQNKIIAPILIATKYDCSSSYIQMSVYDDDVVNPIVCGASGISEVLSEVLKKFPNLKSLGIEEIPNTATAAVMENAESGNKRQGPFDNIEDLTDTLSK